MREDKPKLIDIRRKRWVIVCTIRGVFVGTRPVQYNGQQALMGFFGLGADKMGGSPEVYKAVTFDTEDEASKYIEERLGHDPVYTYLIKPVWCAGDYVSCLDLLEQGFGNSIGDMFCYLPSAEQTMRMMQ